MPVGQKPDYQIAGLPDIHYNPLQQFRNSTYNMRLTMMPSKEAPLARPLRSYDSKKGIIMFETGGTGTVNLEEMTMETVGTGNPTGNYMMQLHHVFRGRLIEPIGGRLIESLSMAAMKLNYPNNSDAVYLLEIWFVGYDDNDEPVTCVDWEDKPLEFRYYVRLNQLKMQLDFRGAVYEFELMPDIGRGVLGDYMNLEQGFRMTANPGTIGDFCKNLESALNKREEEKVEAGLRCFPHKYVITAHKKIKDMKFDYSFFSRGNWSWAQNTGETQIQAGTTIPNFITNTINNSKEFMKFLHRVDDGKKDYNSPDTKPGTIKFGARSVSIIPGAKMQEKGGDILFDSKLNGPAMEIHLFVTTKEDPKLIISPQEFADAASENFRGERVQRWIDMGLLRKVYRWLYTGENTEVLNADIKLDYLWRVVRPLWINSETGKPVAPGSVQPPAKEPPAGKNNAKTIKCDEAKTVQAKEESQEQLYAEDFPFRPGQDEKSSTAPTPTWKPQMPQFYHANTQVQQAQAQSAMMEESAHEYSVYRQIHNQVGAGAADMYTLNIEVVGDPYWLMQIPTRSGEVPWEEDVWEYEKEQWEDETLAEKRKSTATHNWLPLFLFEAQVPSANLNEEDVMDLRYGDAITGIYGVKKVLNSFTKGKFTTKLDAYRETLANPWTSKDNKKTENQDKPANTGSARSVGPTSAGTSGGEANLGTIGA